MKRLLALCLLAVPACAPLPEPSSTPAAAQPPDYAAAFSFDHARPDGRPAYWFGRPPETLAVDSTTVRSAPYSGRIQRGTEHPEGGGSMLGITVPVNFKGDTVELRGWLRTEGVAGWAGLWLRVDDSNKEQLGLNNMGQRRLSGTTPWTHYQVRVPLYREAKNVVVGALLVGRGTVWADDLELFVDGTPVPLPPSTQTQ